jgi:hypothetical protein
MSGHPIVGQPLPTNLSQRALARTWPSANGLDLPQSTTMTFAAASLQTVQLEEQIKNLKIPPSPGALKSTATSSIEESLFDATAAVKILTAQVAMHLDREWRTKLFRQLDSLHDPSEWEPSDSPIRQSSFATFLKAICDIKPTRRPGLGLTSAGHLIAAWTTSKDDRLTIEFLPNDRVRWVMSMLLDDDIERLAGQTTVARLRDRLQPYEPGRWFDNAEKS